MIIQGVLLLLLQVYESVCTALPEMVPLSRHPRKAIRDLRYRWTNGIIPYDFSIGQFNATERSLAREAIKIWSDNTCLVFRPATYWDKNKVVFKDGNTCYSMIGMVGGTQNIIMGKAIGCRSTGLYLHEIGHTIGLLHEHQLPGRDRHITVHLGKVYSGAQNEFRKLRSDFVNNFGVPYDLTSIMHYGRNAMTAKSHWKTMETRDPDKNYMMVPVSYKNMLAFSDMKVVNLMYNCAKHCAKNIPCPKPGYLDKHCKCVQPHYIEYCRNRDARCETWKGNDQCEEAKIFMEFNCPISCGYCSPRDGLTHDVFPTQPPKKIDCKDKDIQCQGWANNNQCSENKLYMMESCPVACGFCEPEGGRQNTPPPTEKPCGNTYNETDCVKWAKRGECGINPSFMLKQCKMACGLCSSAGVGGFIAGQIGGEAEEEECKNTYSEVKCYDWAQRDECKYNPGFMLKQCAKACGQCDKNATAKKTTTNTTIAQELEECVNTYDNSECEAWSKDAQCEKNPSFMLKRCAKSCDSCGGKNSTEEEGSGEETSEEEREIEKEEEKDEEKVEEKEKEKQIDKKEVEKEGERKKETKEATTTKPPDPNCRDRSSVCKSWAKAGYCRTNGYTKKNCKKTCGTC